MCVHSSCSGSALCTNGLCGRGKEEVGRKGLHHTFRQWFSSPKVGHNYSVGILEARREEKEPEEEQWLGGKQVIQQISVCLKIV